MTTVEAMARALIDGREWSHPQQREFWLGRARAALAALDPPSPEMVEAMKAAMWRTLGPATRGWLGNTANNLADGLLQAFKAAIAAALKEGGG